MAWTSINNSINYEILILYISAIFWTLGYDTIYGAQDISDDEIIGLKSTAIKFKKNIKLFVGLNYLVTFLFMSYLFFYSIGLNLFTFWFSLFALSLIYQIITFTSKNKNSCLKAFKMNNFSGLFLFLGIYLINI